MGFSLKTWVQKVGGAVVGELRKINIGKDVRAALGRSASEVLGDVGATARNVNDAATATTQASRLFPWILGGVAVVVVILLVRRR